MSAPDPIYPTLLASTLSTFGCQTGTVHRTTADGQHLSLVCQTGVPDALLDKITLIPFGKGIAGAAAERREPVELCNLQQDLGGVARPDARQTGVAGSVAVPILSGETGAVIGTLGIGKYVPYEFTEAEKEQLAGVAAEIAGHFGHKALRDD
ncbi:MAG: GAF domain-containing protein [Verrucomicrobiaceae bacterium]|nr:MAG: GAF domain-containing protein [Verrucomicrobiaceae bacterium]